MGGKTVETSKMVIIAYFFYIEMYEIHQICALMKPVYESFRAYSKGSVKYV